MMTRAGLDARHASKAERPRERRNLVIKVTLTEFAEVRFHYGSLLGLCAFSTVLQSIVFSKFLGVLVPDLRVGAPPAAEAPPSAFQVLREAFCGGDLKGTWSQAGEEVRDEATF